MNDADVRSVSGEQVILSSKYGGLPRSFWYFVIPFLVLVSTVFFIRAVWFGEGILVRNVRVPPDVITFAICPLIWGLCGLLVALEVYRFRNPQRILVTTWGVKLPKGRFTSETVCIAWEDLEAKVEARNLSGWHVYEFICTDLRNEASVRVNSMLFRDFEDFATFMLIMAEHMGQDWKIRGFWPGTIRGRKAHHSFFDRG